MEIIMSTPENYLRAVVAMNERMWPQAESLQKQLQKLESEYQAARQRPITDVIARGVAALLEAQINDVVRKLNTVYEEWQRNLTLIAPPPSKNPASNWTSKIPWPKAVPPDVRKQLLRIIQQGGIPISHRVTVKPVKFPSGGQGIAVEFSKW
ncbi:MAG TPA: hypothetical protein P5102_08020 [Candidatus Competibacteraceae bacterium]|nr:hypothetical protein [Candidatus Competibacteraceae bacterium]HRZ06085.1 hypothetical protein [Candidatus Competibacteraceae bacterium]HSA46059.1 hypothetical protein [Candidatus Competibacteraceae bacterium]